MDFSSSSSSRTWRYHVFVSFHGRDVGRTFLSHLRKELNYNGITANQRQRTYLVASSSSSPPSTWKYRVLTSFHGPDIRKTFAPALTEAIRESRISIVVLSKNYASSSWCVDELLEILKCKENIGQIVRTVFYGVDPSDVRKQTGDFGIAFNKTCARKTEEERRRWTQALNDVVKITGNYFINGDNESKKMTEKIASDISRYFEDISRYLCNFKILQVITLRSPYFKIF